MRKLWRVIGGFAVLALFAGGLAGQDWDDGGLMAFEDMIIDEAINGDLPVLDDDDFFLDALMDDVGLDGQEPLPDADQPPAMQAPAMNGDDLFDLIAGLEDEPPAVETPDPDPVALPVVPATDPEDDPDDLLGMLGLDEFNDVFPPEPDQAMADVPVDAMPHAADDDELDALWNDVTARAEPAPEDEDPIDDLDLWIMDPDFNGVAATPPAGEDQTTTPEAEPEPEDLDDLMALLLEDEPPTAPPPVEVAAPLPFDDADALDADLVDTLVGRVRAEVDEDAPEEFILEDVIAAMERDIPAPPEPPTPPVVAPTRHDPGVTAFATQERLRRIAEESHGIQSLRAGERQLAAQEVQRAIISFEEALRFIPDQPEHEEARARARRGLAGAYYMQAISFERAEDYEQALAAAIMARNNGYVRAESLIRRIRRRMDIGPVVPAPPPTTRWEEDTYRSLQDEIQTWLKRGREAYLVGEYERAHSAFGSVLKRDPHNKEAIRMRRLSAQKMHERASMEVESTRARMMAAVRETWNPRDYGIMETPVDVGIGPGQIEAPEPERLRIIEKMNRIRLPEIDFRQANIRDVIDFLHHQSVEHDPTDDRRRGVNIILRLEDDAAPAAAPRRDAFAADPFADPFGAPAGVPGLPGGDQLITFSALDITLKEALDIVVEISRLKYRIRGSVVMIVPADVADSEIIHRMYDVLPTVVDRFRELGAAVGGMQQPQAGGFGGGFQPMPAAGAAGAEPDWKVFFAEMGVEWPARSSIRYVPQIGKLIVANTADNLALFERVLSVLNVVPFQIEIEARFVEVMQTDIDSLGFEWLLHNTWQIAERRSDANLSPAARRRIVATSSPDQGSLTRGNRFLTRNPIAGMQPVSDNMATIGTILTNPELSMVLHALQQRGHTDLLSAPKVTTKSGQEATIKVVTEYIYPTEFETQGIGGATTTTGTGAGLGAGGTVGAVVTPSAFETREVGVILRVVPRVTPEGQMIDLDLEPQVVSEPTWRNYGSSYTSYDPFGNPQVQELNMEQPFFHTRALQTSMLMYNGATVVMGGMITEVRVDVDDKVPLLGDIPILGRLFRSQYQRSEKRNLLIFVTARLVDPAGRPLDQARLDMQGDAIADALTRREGTSSRAVDTGF